MKALCQECKMRVEYSGRVAWMGGSWKYKRNALERHEVYKRDEGKWVECPGSGQEVARA